jgi:hypothetical protein
MARMSSQFLFGIACFAWMSPGNPTVLTQQEKPAQKPATSSDESKEAAWLRGAFFREMSAYHFYLDAERQHEFPIRREPALRYPAAPGLTAHCSLTRTTRLTTQRLCSW